MSFSDAVVAAAPGGAVETYLFPLTFQQARLWFLEQLEPGTTAYLIPWALRIRGQLDVPALEQALNAVVARHEVLRTRFVMVQGEPQQEVVASLLVPLPLIDLSSLPNGESEAARLAQQDASTPLDLEHGPVIRARLVRIDRQHHLLLLTMHHIIFDGWSRSIMVHELGAFYDAFAAGKQAVLPELPIQYGDYAVWQREQMQGEYFTRQVEFWKSQLEGAPACIDLPGDRPRPAVQTYNGASEAFHMAEPEVAELKTLSRTLGATLYMVLLG